MANGNIFKNAIEVVNSGDFCSFCGGESHLEPTVISQPGLASDGSRGWGLVRGRPPGGVANGVVVVPPSPLPRGLVGLLRRAP